MGKCVTPISYLNKGRSEGAFPYSGQNTLTSRGSGTRSPDGGPNMGSVFVHLTPNIFMACIVCTACTVYVLFFCDDPRARYRELGCIPVMAVI